MNSFSLSAKADDIICYIRINKLPIITYKFGKIKVKMYSAPNLHYVLFNDVALLRPLVVRFSLILI